ncbi:hypothetical protein Pelo_4848 [Pelomyxa schiedti]|nr:hypothetical protein Pelo_4848 [Pelomyxa schiedti]
MSGTHCGCASSGCTTSMHCRCVRSSKHCDDKCSCSPCYNTPQHRKWDPADSPKKEKVHHKSLPAQESPPRSPRSPRRRESSVTSRGSSATPSTRKRGRTITCGCITTHCEGKFHCKCMRANKFCGESCACGEECQNRADESGDDTQIHVDSAEGENTALKQSAGEQPENASGEENRSEVATTSKQKTEDGDAEPPREDLPRSAKKEAPHCRRTGHDQASCLCDKCVSYRTSKLEPKDEGSSPTTTTLEVTPNEHGALEFTICDEVFVLARNSELSRYSHKLMFFIGNEAAAEHMRVIDFVSIADSWVSLPQSSRKFHIQVQEKRVHRRSGVGRNQEAENDSSAARCSSEEAEKVTVIAPQLTAFKSHPIFPEIPHITPIPSSLDLPQDAVWMSYLRGALGAPGSKFSFADSETLQIEPKILDTILASKHCRRSLIVSEYPKPKKGKSKTNECIHWLVKIDTKRERLQAEFAKLRIVSRSAVSSLFMPVKTFFLSTFHGSEAAFLVMKFVPHVPLSLWQDKPQVVAEIKKDPLDWLIALWNLTLIFSQSSGPVKISCNDVFAEQVMVVDNRILIGDMDNFEVTYTPNCYSNTKLLSTSCVRSKTAKPASAAPTEAQGATSTTSSSSCGAEPSANSPLTAVARIILKQLTLPNLPDPAVFSDPKEALAALRPVLASQGVPVGNTQTNVPLAAVPASDPYAPSPTTPQAMSPAAPPPAPEPVPLLLPASTTAPTSASATTTTTAAASSSSPAAPRPPPSSS